ncbi:hypothetical protein BY996DRAFT_8451544 [Phakopsora pachyrhizi]|nr:hypothetical protein BY996DRAFT_8451544 [Phakopsora pachyrhizi]
MIPFNPPASSLPTTRSDIIKNPPGSSKHITVLSHPSPSTFSTDHRLPKSLTNLSSDTEDSKYHNDSASYNPGNPSSSGTKLTSPEVEASISDVEHQIVYLTSQNHIPDQINWSSDRSHLQQTFHLSYNPLRMHNSSLSSASSSTDSWDFDPDLIIPDGPLTLLQSDSKNNTEDSSVSHLVKRVKSSETVVRPRTDDSERTFINLVALNLRMRMRLRMRNKVEEAEDDIDKGFFDDIEFHSEFGIPNNNHQTSTPSNPSSSFPSSKLHKPTESVHLLSSDSSRIVESKSSYSFPSEHYHQPKSSSTQSFVTAPIIPSSSFSTTIAAPSSGA